MKMRKRKRKRKCMYCDGEGLVSVMIDQVKVRPMCWLCCGRGEVPMSTEIRKVTLQCWDCGSLAEIPYIGDELQFNKEGRLVRRGREKRIMCTECRGEYRHTPYIVRWGKSSVKKGGGR
jgi:hypothetical protein